MMKQLGTYGELRLATDPFALAACTAIHVYNLGLPVAGSERENGNVEWGARAPEITIFNSTVVWGWRRGVMPPDTPPAPEGMVKRRVYLDLPIDDRYMYHGLYFEFITKPFLRDSNSSFFQPADPLMEPPEPEDTFGFPMRVSTIMDSKSEFHRRMWRHLLLLTDDASAAVPLGAMIHTTIPNDIDFSKKNVYTLDLPCAIRPVNFPYTQVFILWDKDPGLF